MLDRHGGEEIVPFQEGGLTLLVIDNAGPGDGLPFRKNRSHLMMLKNEPAFLFHLPGHFLPQLPGSEFGIEESFNKAGLDVFLVDIAGVAVVLRPQGPGSVDNGLADGNALDALSTPLSGDLAAGHSPYFFGIVLEEQPIQFFPEAVDEKIFEALLRFARQEAGPQIRQEYAHGADQAQFFQCIERQVDGIAEEFPEEVNAGKALPNQHNLVSGFAGMVGFTAYFPLKCSFMMVVGD